MATSPQWRKSLLQYIHGEHRQLLLQHMPSLTGEGMMHTGNRYLSNVAVTVVGGKDHQRMLKLARPKYNENENIYMVAKYLPTRYFLITKRQRVVSSPENVAPLNQMIKVTTTWKGTQRHPVFLAPALRRTPITSVGFLPKRTTSLLGKNIRHSQVEGYSQNNWPILPASKCQGHGRLRSGFGLEETKGHD